MRTKTSSNLTLKMFSNCSATWAFVDETGHVVQIYSFHKEPKRSLQAVSDAYRCGFRTTPWREADKPKGALVCDVLYDAE